MSNPAPSAVLQLLTEGWCVGKAIPIGHIEFSYTRSGGQMQLFNVIKLSCHLETNKNKKTNTTCACNAKLSGCKRGKGCGIAGLTKSGSHSQFGAASPGPCSLSTPSLPCSFDAMLGKSVFSPVPRRPSGKHPASIAHYESHKLI